MPVAKIGKRGALIIPAEIRRKTGLKEGDEVLIEVGDDGSIHMLKRPADFTAALRGLYKEIWRGTDPETYVAEERAAWEKE
ncbi:MAG: AbrB/MazE/SpoVT family DNA-binding domain-containing protein [Firmicutes bacterium]|nr:AbrB/MazE/SpoVT family DNA-binding domain-containing protein [Bacillota bacterium]